MRAVLLAIGVAACSHAAPTVAPPAKPVPVVVAKLDPACQPVGPITLPADNHLRCRELPLDVEWPAGTKLTRVDSDATTLFSAELDRGVLLVVAEPSYEDPTPEKFGELLSALVSGIVADATTTPLAPPPLAGATVTAGFTFATPDGGSGVIRGYVAHHWTIAIVAGGRLADTPARPDQPVGKHFLDSLALHAPSLAPVQISIGGAHIEIPSTAWPMKVPPAESEVIAAWGFVVPAHRYGVTIRDITPSDHCDKLRTTRDPDLGPWLKTVFHDATFDVKRASHVKLGDDAIYAEIEYDTRPMAVYLICQAKSFVQLSMVGVTTIDVLRAALEPIAKSFVGSP